MAAATSLQTLFIFLLQAVKRTDLLPYLHDCMHIPPDDSGREQTLEEDTGTDSGDAGRTVVDHGGEHLSLESTNGKLIPTIGYETFTRAKKTIAYSTEIDENPERMEARKYFEQYLAKNVQTVKTLKEMEDMIREFQSCAPMMLVWKCVDGRVHGSKGKGYPIGTITFARTEGAKIDIDSKNARLWKTINSVIVDAEMKTPDMPAIVVILGHHSKNDHHRSCAAHGCNDTQAMQTVQEQTQKIRDEYYSADAIEQYTRDQVYFIHGMTNTDDMSETLVFENGETINSGTIIENLGLSHPSEVFGEKFLADVIHDPTTKKYTKNLTGKRMLEGSEAPMYQDLSVSLAMQAFLMRRISEMVSKHLQNGSEESVNELLNPVVFETLMKKLHEVNGLPPSLKGPLLHQSVWNIAYALYQRTRLSGMDLKTQKEHLDHDEELVCYGEGFETLARNKAILVKPGRGDDVETLKTAKKVLETYSRMKALPMVHINIELTDKIGSWNSYKDNVLAEMWRMKRNVYDVFGRHVRFLCTYSYKHEKKFYPVKAIPKKMPDPNECMNINLTHGFSEKTYSPENISHAEFDYTRDMLRIIKDNGSDNEKN